MRRTLFVDYTVPPSLCRRVHVAVGRIILLSSLNDLKTTSIGVALGAIWKGVSLRLVLITINLQVFLCSYIQTMVYPAELFIF
mmetsp:Transcript_10163/g.16238  ORF Transcript_10163/g.16238 Transcript_10163/m.16238 type:complete len:83 (-) Transcript_10163:745-993(-)